MATRQICTFRVAELLLGLDVAHVQEVLRNQEMTEVPLAPFAVKGLLNLRGQIVTAIDLRRRLGLPAAAGVEPMNVIMLGGGSVVSLLVDSIGDVEAVRDDALAPLPVTLDATTKGIASSVCKLASGLLLVLDPRGVLAGIARPGESAGGLRHVHGN